MADDDDGAEIEADLEDEDDDDDIGKRPRLCVIIRFLLEVILLLFGASDDSMACVLRSTWYVEGLIEGARWI